MGVAKKISKKKESTRITKEFIKGRNKKKKKESEKAKKKSKKNIFFSKQKS